MNLRQMRWPVVLVALAVSLAGLFGTGHLVKSRTVDQPLLEALGSIEGLESYAVHRVGETQEIVVRPSPAADLKQTYSAVDREARRILATGQYEIQVEDRGNPDFAEAANRFDLYVQEGIATGQYAAMADRIEEAAAALGAEAEVAVDNERVYLAVRRGEDYLYRVVERPDYQTPAPVGGGMGL